MTSLADLPPRCSSARRHGQAGFTLLEMLVVLAVLGLAVLIIAGNGPARSPALDARAAAEQVAAALRLARSQAVAGNRRVTLALDLAARRFRIGDGPVQALPPGLDITMLAVADEAAGAGVGAGAGASGRSTGSIGFAPDGSSSGGRIRFAAGRSARFVGVDWLTGRVTVADAP